jgi:hypothetical protein
MHTDKTKKMTTKGTKHTKTAQVFFVCFEYFVVKCFLKLSVLIRG